MRASSPSRVTALRPWGAAGWFSPYLFVQGHDGMSRRLDLYDQRETTLRLGLSFRQDHVHGRR